VKIPKHKHPGDQIELFDRMVRGGDDEDSIALPRYFLVLIADLLKQVPKPPGRPIISGRDKVQESLIISRARARKAKLIAGGMPKGKATEMAAKEAQAQFLKMKRKRPLSIATIERRMQKRRQPRH
jgi:hypothetical protein